MTYDDDDRLPLDKPKPMKTTDKILLGILILVLLVTFPFIWWIYRPLIWILFRFVLPVGIIGFIAYFAFRALRLGDVNGSLPGEGSFSQKLGVAWREFIFVVRKYFKTVALTAIVFILVFVVSAIAYTKSSRRAVTQKQMDRTAQALSKHKNHYGNYPANLAELIGNDPLKREWLRDAWGNPIEYSLTKNGLGYSLISPGADALTGNGDDVVVAD